ncbi:SDR family NAD(P)-dependent oxidoreductase [Sorangium sp. So ce1099]|uniref:SDR family NAD(P)-dependent oxidoreductase n=1 Tax=Sorangium sp. So ce1099 TaxID=3133331 RepID=UPI003F61F056
MILITGATGTIGREVVRQLVERGAPVRALTRDPAKAAALGREVDLVRGDFEEPASLRPALEGVEALFMLSAPGPSIAAHDLAMVDAAQKSGVKRLVKLSAFGADLPSRIGDWHRAGEHAVRTSGLAWTLLRPVGFASNVLQWAAAIRAGGVVPISTGDGRQGIIHPGDVAAVAVAALTSAHHDGSTYTLTGPELLSARDQVASLARALGRSIETTDVPPDRLREQMLAAGAARELAETVFEGVSFLREGKAAALSDDVEAVLGRKPLRFEAWVRENLAAFGAAPGAA